MMQMLIDTRKISVPEEILTKWQSLIDNIAEIIDVPAALVVKVDDIYYEVLCATESDKNPYKIKDHGLLANMYCEMVVKHKDEVLIVNALKDKNWSKHPNVKLGLISYLGFPLLWPNGDIFGTICIFDTKENRYKDIYHKLMLQSKELVEAQLQVLYTNSELEFKNNELLKSQAEIRTLRGLIPICASCKKIRNDAGLWQQIESYIRDHSEAEFTHSFCPDCMRKNYPEYKDL